MVLGVKSFTTLDYSDPVLEFNHTFFCTTGQVYVILQYTLDRQCNTPTVSLYNERA